MATNSKKATWGAVKAQLQQMDHQGLVHLLGDIYRSGPENRRFLHARLLGSKVELDNYRKLVVDAIFPEPLSQRPVRIAEAERLIRHYRQATGDLEGTVDLMLSFVEAGTDLVADYGYDEERYFGALERVLDGAAAQLTQLPPDSRQHAVQRIEWIADKARTVGWGYCDSTRAVADEVRADFAPPTLVKRSGAQARQEHADSSR